MPDEKNAAVATAPAVKQQHGEAAFFDVDNTLMRGASLFHVARKMYERKAFTLSQAAGFAWKQFKFVLRGENMDDVHAVRDSALVLAAGIRVSEVEELGEEVYDEMIESRIWPGTKALAEQHLRVGRKVWLVTATPVEVASVIATRLGLTHEPAGVGAVFDFAGSWVTSCTDRRKPLPFSRWQTRKGWTSSAAGPTATPTTTSPCSPWWGTRCALTPTPPCAAMPAKTTGPFTTSARAAAQPHLA